MNLLSTMKQTTKLTALGFVFALIFSFQARASYLADFRFFVNDIERNYVALEEKHFLHLPALKEKYEARLQTVQTQEEFHRLLQEFIGEFKDSHFSTHFQSNEVSTLGLMIDKVGGKFLVTGVDHKIFPSGIPIAPGDEIVDFDGRPVAEEVAKIARFIGKSSEKTTLRYATMMLTQRHGYVVPLRSGESAVKVKSRKSKSVKTFKLRWITRPDSEFPHPYCDVDQSPIAVPRDAVRVEAPSTAYYLPQKGSKPAIGFLRIPNYDIDYKNPKEDFENKLKSYKRALAELEQHTGILVIDQTFNCGGNTEFAEALLSFFMSSNFTPAQYLFIANDDQLKYWTETRDKQETDEGKKRVNSIVLRIKKAIEKRDRLTVQSSLFGNETVKGEKVYTKPVFLLINEFTASAAEVFATYMQDLNRATIIGSQSMRAGTHPPSKKTVLPQSQISIKIPNIMFYRLNGTAIEQRGAKPDIPYEVSSEDVLGGYEAMREFIFKKAASSLAK